MACSFIDVIHSRGASLATVRIVWAGCDSARASRGTSGLSGLPLWGHDFKFGTQIKFDIVIDYMMNGGIRRGSIGNRE